MTEEITFTGERYIPEYFVDTNDEIVKEHEDRYNSIIKIITNRIVLDAACGSGYGSYEISKHAKSVIGIDISDESINYAIKNYKSENLNFEVASVTNLPFLDNSFDVVVSFETIEHISEEAQILFLKQIKNVLKDDGYFVISTPDKLNYSDKSNYKNEFHIKEFYEDEFYKFLLSFFKNVKFYYQTEEVCNLIYDKNSKNLKLNSFDFDISGKYIIAICSDSNIDELQSIGSISITNNKNEFFKMRIQELQKDVDEKNNWAFNLNHEIDNKNSCIKSLNENLEEKEEKIKSLNENLEEKEEKIKSLNEELNNVYTSKSCKITAPFRSLFNIIKYIIKGKY